MDQHFDKYKVWAMFNAILMALVRMFITLLPSFVTQLPFGGDCYRWYDCVYIMQCFDGLGLVCIAVVFQEKVPKNINFLQYIYHFPKVYL